MTWDALLPATVLTPVAFAVVAAVVRGRASTAAGLSGTVVGAVIAAVVALRVGVAGPLEQQLAGWSPPLGITLRADGLGAVFLALTAVVGTATAVYAAPRTTGHDQGRSFWPLWLLLMAGLAGVFLTGDLFNAYVALEVVSLSAVGLVALGGRSSWEPALRYLLVAVLGSLFFLVSVAAVYGMTGTLDMQAAGAVIAASPDADTRWPLALAVVGLGIKSALLPVHAWLPPAHASAPSMVSPVLSALVVKAAFVVLVRVWFEVLGPDPAVAAVLAACGAGALVGGGLLALAQTSLKRLVAYSTVAQVGYLYLLFPLTASTSDERVQRSVWAGVMLLAVAHGLAKAALFLAAGSLKLAAGTDDLDGIIGAARNVRSVTIALMLAVVSLAGLPISLGFAGKWILVTGAVQAGQWWAVVLVVAASLLSAAYLLRPVAAVLRDSDTAEEVGRARLDGLPRPLRHAPLALAVIAIALGLSSGWLADLSLVGSTVDGGP